MSMINLVFFHYAVLLIFGCVSFVLGKWFLGRTNFNSASESIGFSLTFGAGVIAYIVFFLTLLKLLYSWVLAILLIALVLIAIFTSPTILTDVKRGFTLWRSYFCKLFSQKYVLAFGGCLALIVGSSILLPLYPPTTWDAIEYHLPVAKIYAQSHGMVFTEFLRYPVYSQLNHMLFTLMLIFSDDISAQLVQYLFYLLIAILIYAFGQRYFSRPVGVLAAVMWLANFLAIEESKVADIDLGLVLFGTAGVMAFFIYYKTRQKNWLFIASILLGFAAAVKYTALIWIVFCGLFTIWIGLREKDWRIPVLFGLISGLVACPFYLRNAYHTGDPFFPYISIFFKENIWNNADLKRLTGEQASYGVPRTLLNFIKLPLYLRSIPLKFHSNMRPYNMLFLAFLPVTLVVGILKPSLRMLFAFCLGFTLFWFFTPHVLRYLLPVFPLYCLLVAAAFGFLLDTGWLFIQKKLQHPLPINLKLLFYLVLIFYATFITVRYNLLNTRNMGLPPTSQAKKEEFLQDRLSSYSAYQLLNKTENIKNRRLYALFDENMVYYFDGIFMGDWFGPARYVSIINVLPDSRKLYSELIKLNAQYFLFQGNRSFGNKLPNDAFFQEKFRKIYDNYGVQLFEILSP